MTRKFTPTVIFGLFNLHVGLVLHHHGLAVLLWSVNIGIFVVINIVKVDDILEASINLTHHFSLASGLHIFCSHIYRWLSRLIISRKTHAFQKHIATASLDQRHWFSFHDCFRRPLFLLFRRCKSTRIRIFSSRIPIVAHRFMSLKLDLL